MVIRGIGQAERDVVYRTVDKAGVLRPDLFFHGDA